MTKLNKYIVYLDDGETVMKLYLTGEDDDDIRNQCHGNGEIIAIKDVTSENFIDYHKVENALVQAGFEVGEAMFIMRTLDKTGIVG